MQHSTVNVMRLSRIVKRNLEKETADDEYNAEDAGAGQDDVQLHNPDAEVDFGEGDTDDGMRLTCSLTKVNFSYPQIFLQNLLHSPYKDTVSYEYSHTSMK